MAKYFNSRVKTGKLAGSVFAIRNGETIERAYQPIVANPSTVAQVQSRAKLKLMSQLSAVLAPAIAIKRKGAVSSRNLFTKKNYALAGFADNQATIQLAQVQLTSSVVDMPNINVTREGSTLNVSLATSLNDLDRVVYVILLKDTDNKLRLLTSNVVSRGDTPNFQTTFTLNDSFNLVVYAYGMRDNSDLARATFGDLTAPTAETIAKILTSRVLLDSDVTLTETRGVESPSATSAMVGLPEERSKKKSV